MPFAKTQCALELIKDATKIAKEANGLLKVSDLKQIFDNMDARKGEKTMSDAAREITGEFVSQKRFDSLRAKRNAIYNAAAKKKIMSDAELLHKSGLSYAKSFHAQPAGEYAHLGSGSRINAETERKTSVAVEHGKFMGAIKKNGLMAIAQSKALEPHVNTAMRSLAPPEVGLGKINTKILDDLHPAVRDKVMKYAQIRIDSAKRMHALAVQRGILQSPRGIYTGHVTHDTTKIRNADSGAPDRLRNRTTEKSHDYYVKRLTQDVDLAKTRQNLVNLGRLGPLESLSPHQFFNRLADIMQGAPRKELRSGDVEYPGNIAAAAEKAHILEFKDAAAQARYNQEFGTGDGLSSHLHMIDQNAHAASSMNHFGPNAEANLNEAYDTKLLQLGQLKEDLRNAGKPSSEIDAVGNEIDGMNQGMPDMKHYMDGYLGLNRQPGNVTVARIGAGTRAVLRMALLGKAVFAQMPTLVTGPTLMHMGGVPLLRSMFHVWAGLLERQGSGKQDWLRRQGVGIEGITSYLATSLTEGIQGAQPGQIIKSLENIFYKGTGFTFMRDSTASGIAYGLSNDIAHDASLGKDWSALDFGRKQLFSDYRIGAKEWDIIRQHTSMEANGYKLVASDKIADVPLEKFSGIGGASTDWALRNARTDLELKLATLFHDSAMMGTVTPDLKTHLETPMVNTRPGTFQGELARFTMQFSVWGWAHAMMVLNRNAKALGHLSSPTGFLKFYGGFLGALTLMGMTGFTIKQLIAGRNPLSNPDLASDDPTTASTAWAKFIGTGALTAGASGMLGDTLLSQSLYNGRGNSGTELGGPIKDDASQILHFTYDALLQGKVDGPQMLKFAQSNTPFINAWWLKPFVDYLFMYGLEEQLNPGSLERMERQSAKNGLPFFFQPSQNAVR